MKQSDFLKKFGIYGLLSLAGVYDQLSRPRRAKPQGRNGRPHQGARECERRRRQLGLGEFAAR